MIKKVYEKMLNGHVLRKRYCYDKRFTHCLYSGNNPMLNITFNTYMRLSPLLKEKKGVYTLNLNEVRKLNGHHTAKILYKKYRTLKEKYGEN